MEIFNTYYTEEYFWSSSSSAEDNGISSSSSKSAFSDEEVILASNNPKKRAGRKKFRETRHPVYRGVRRRNSGKWVCERAIGLPQFRRLGVASAGPGVFGCEGHSEGGGRGGRGFSASVVGVGDEIKEEEDAGAAVESPENDDVFYMDEEAVFGMHGLLANMAEGLMLPPPQYSDDVEVDADVSLWSFSI
ncbi:hypothetical protein DH2020_030937 [Rehmannia glutinosa]|uniref:Uncharacterized protein n=1 Tax=Rehmannia glutinosa TaxID=99300 RepID=A0ABR0VND2_REHGL